MNILLSRIISRLKRELKGILIKTTPAVYYKNVILRDISNLKCPNVKNPQKKDVPFITIESSNICNLNCLMCRTNEATRKKFEMPKELFEKLVVQNVKFGQKLLVIHTVGEPFICSYLEDIFKMCLRYKIFLNITTNGLLIPERIGLIRKYPGAIKYIAFSIDGATKKTYERIRNGANFETLIKSLDLIKEYNKRFFGKIQISLQACISKENFEEIPLFYKIFKSYFKPEQILFNFIDSITATQPEDKYFINNLPLKSNFYRRRCPCNLLWLEMHILNDGKVSVCCRDYNGELIAGDINTTSILDIWNSAQYEMLRYKHLSGTIEDIPLCKTCYISDRYFTKLFNYYTRYLFIKYGNKNEKYYLDKLDEFLTVIDDLDYSKEFDKTRILNIL